MGQRQDAVDFKGWSLGCRRWVGDFQLLMDNRIILGRALANFGFFWHTRSSAFCVLLKFIVL